MLALASGLIVSPSLLILDEPSMGLAPTRANLVLQRIRNISDESGTAILIVEQRVREVLKIAHYVFVLRNGDVTFRGPTEALDTESKLRDVYL